MTIQKLLEYGEHVLRFAVVFILLSGFVGFLQNFGASPTNWTVAVIATTSGLIAYFTRPLSR